MSTPQSIIHICSGVRLDPRYVHSIYFANKTAQQEYFAGKVVKTFPAYSYLRKSWPLQVEATMEQAKTWTYLYFQNGTGKMYYYFITQIQYKNDNTVELSLELDVLQTYLFDFELLDCFVERQHTETDGIGEHTIEEGLDVGELVDNVAYHCPNLQDKCILVLATINPNYADTEKPIQAMAGMYNSTFSGLKVWAVDSAKWAKWGNQIDALSEAGFLDGIIAMWMYPSAMVTLGGENTWDDAILCKTVDRASNVTFSLPYSATPATVDGYTPRNKKLLCYPYNFLYLTNNLGGTAVYRYERFESFDHPEFTVVGALSPEGAVKIYPKAYNGLDNYDQGLTLGNFPTCAWDSDVYKMWLAQNQNQMIAQGATAGVSIAAGIASTVASAATGNVAGIIGGVTAMANGATQIGNILAQKADMAIQPPQSKGSFSSNVNMTANRHTFSFIQKSVSAETAKILDDYFTMYGYKINRVRKPNIHARDAFTYVKTVGCQIKGTMCTEDMVKIESIFDQGVTFWANGDKVADYTQTNN